MIVAIDGPAGAGKSTVARAVAGALGVGYLDTGAMYRALTLVALRDGVAIDDGPELAELARTHPVSLEGGPGGARVMMRGDDVTMAIREADVTAAVSEVAAHPEVRSALVARQRQIMEHGDWVCDGRDIGSVVFPEARLKVFLDCDVEARALRRDNELQEKGLAMSRSAVRDNLKKRDRIDSGRSVAPLVRVPDAVLVDTTLLSIEEQVAVVCDLARRRLAQLSA